MTRQVTSPRSGPPCSCGGPELSEWRFVAADNLDAYLPAPLARRLRACLLGTAVYLENGEEPAGAVRARN